MADFKKYYPVLLRNEGGYANNKLDSGGETWSGIARNSWPAWPGWKIVDRLKLGLTVSGINKALRADATLADMVYQFYKVNFWNSLQLDFVNSQPLAEQLCDMGVNSGAMRPAKMVQWILKNQDVGHSELEVDGDIGPATIRAINSIDPKVLYKIFVMLRKAFYYYRVGHLDEVTEKQRIFFYQQLNLRSKADQIVFLKSWLSRCVPETI